MASAHDYVGPSDGLTPLELHIVGLLGELTASIGALVGDESDDEYSHPLAEFDQRLLLEHVQVIERYILAQVAARAYPERFRLLGHALPGAALEPGDGPGSSEHARAGRGRAELGHDHGDGHHHDHGSTSQHVADPEAAREAHLRGRAIIGEHPWEPGHDHGDGDLHPDEWEWEPFDEGS